MVCFVCCMCPVSLLELVVSVAVSWLFAVFVAKLAVVVVVDLAVVRI